jgi:hypothetical protein
MRSKPIPNYQNIWFPSGDSMLLYPKYKSEALLLVETKNEKYILMTFYHLLHKRPEHEADQSFPSDA